MFNKFKTFCISHKASLVLLTVLVVAGVAHAYNMFNFPYYENDEGVYMSQAWSVIKMGSLAPYTYWYDHAPAGWLFIAVWAKLTGGFFTFGASVNSGRVFMLVLHLLSTAMVFSITRKLTNNKLWAAALAGLLFSISPLAIYFQRRVLLDNIMTFWALLSYWLLVREKLKLRHVLLSAVVFGIAALSKENAVFFLPALVYTIYTRSHTTYRRMGLALWACITGLVGGLYVLYAVIKSELLPMGFLGSTTAHVSLIESLKQQAGRGSGFHFWNPNSDIYRNMVEWISRDPFLIYGAVIAIGISIVLAYWQKNFREPLLFTLGMVFFLMRGGLVINFYFLPLVPFVAILMSLIAEKTYGAVVGVLHHDLELFKLRHMFGPVLFVCVLAGLSLAVLTKPLSLYVTNETSPMLDSLNWIKHNLPQDSNIIIDNALFVDTRDSRFAGDPEFPNSQWFWKVEKDPEVYKTALGNDWLNADYVALSHEMVIQQSYHNIEVIGQMLPYMEPVKGWSNGGAYLNIASMISTNGDWMRIYKVNSRTQFFLASTWQKDKEQSFQSYGQIVNGPQTTAGEQGLAMLRAVYANDKTGFDGLWSWTRDHLQYRSQDKLISERWGVGPNGQAQTVDSEAKLTSNQDIALALELAGQKWHNQQYTTDALTLIQSTWSALGVLDAAGHVKLSASTAVRPDGYKLIDPSTFAPGHYRAFAELDTTHNWNDAAENAYAGISQNRVRLLEPLKKIEMTTILPRGNELYKLSQVWSISFDAVTYKSPTAQAVLAQLKLASAEHTPIYYAASLGLQDRFASQYQTLLMNALFDRSQASWRDSSAFTEQSQLWLLVALGGNQERPNSAPENATVAAVQ